jgi:hypothetical protein
MEERLRSGSGFYTALGEDMKNLGKNLERRLPNSDGEISKANSYGSLWLISKQT